MNHKKSSLFPSQDMTYLEREILSVRFIEEPTETRIGNLLRIREEFSLVPKPPSISIPTSWAIQQRQGVDLSLPVPDLSLCSYASDVGCGGQQVSGEWTPCQKRLSINLREMMAVHKGLLGLSRFLRGETIALFCDKMTTVTYLRPS